MSKKKLKKAQTGGEMTAGQKAEARRDSIYNSNKARTKAKMDSLYREDAFVNSSGKKDTTKSGPTRMSVAKKKTGG